MFKILFVISLLFIQGISGLDKVIVQDQNALCLDGSLGAYYFERGLDTTTIVLYFEGGGWCGGQNMADSIDDCYQRSKTDYGSSLKYPDKISWTEGILSINEKNSFMNATRVLLKYCDGTGHQGSRRNPVVYKGTSLYFRGHNVTIGQFNSLEKKLGLFSNFQTIIVSGGSAGGLAAFMWVDYVKQKAPKAKVFGVPDSGIFLDFPTFDTKIKKYSNLLQNVYKISNSQISTPISQCEKRFPQSQYKCMFAENMISFIKSPIFVIQSLYDSWAIQNILNIHCTNYKPSLSNCSKEEMKSIEEYHTKTFQLLEKITNLKVNGIWGISCATHGFLHASRYYNMDYRIPMNSVNSIDATLANWIQSKQIQNNFVDKINWPNNIPCSGQSKILYE